MAMIVGACITGWLLISSASLVLCLEPELSGGLCEGRPDMVFADSDGAGFVACRGGVAHHLRCQPRQQFHAGHCRRPRSELQAQKCSEPDGVYPDYGSGCRSFYFCRGGRKTALSCPASLLFDWRLGRCRPASKVGCPRLRCDTDGVFPDRVGGCRRYFRCQDGERDEALCPQGELFDAGRCQNSTGVVCEGDNGCAALPDAFYPAPGCAQFVLCVAGNAREFACPSDLIFSRKLLACDYPKKASCEVPDASCAPGSNGLFPLAGCREFAVCRDGSLLKVGSCPKGTAFDATSLTCRPPRDVSCTSPEDYADPECVGRADGVYVGTTADTFYACIGQVKVATSVCPDGSTFDPSEQTCRATGRAAADGVAYGEYECEGRIGVFPDFRSSCYSYRVCADGMEIVQDCGEGLSFDPESGRCIEEAALCRPPRVVGTFRCPEGSPGLFVDESSGCRLWHECVGSEGVSYACPRGHSFDPEKMYCRANVGCSEAALRPRASVSVTGTILRLNDTDFDVDCGDFAEVLPSVDRRDFHVCAPSGAFSFRCPGSTVFDPERNACDVDRGVDVTDLVRPGEDDFSCDGRRDGLYPDETLAQDCARYYSCEGGRKRTMLCAPGTRFNTVLLLCSSSVLCHVDRHFSVTAPALTYSASVSTTPTTTPTPPPPSTTTTPATTAVSTRATIPWDIEVTTPAPAPVVTQASPGGGSGRTATRGTTWADTWQGGWAATRAATRATTQPPVPRTTRVTTTRPTTPTTMRATTTTTTTTTTTSTTPSPTPDNRPEIQPEYDDYYSEFVPENAAGFLPEGKRLSPPGTKQKPEPQGPPQSLRERRPDLAPASVKDRTPTDDYYSEFVTENAAGFTPEGKRLTTPVTTQNPATQAPPQSVPERRPDLVPAPIKDRTPTDDYYSEFAPENAAGFAPEGKRLTTPVTTQKPATRAPPQSVQERRPDLVPAPIKDRTPTDDYYSELAPENLGGFAPEGKRLTTPVTTQRPATQAPPQSVPKRRPEPVPTPIKDRTPTEDYYSEFGPENVPGFTPEAKRISTTITTQRPAPETSPQSLPESRPEAVPAPIQGRTPTNTRTRAPETLPELTPETVLETTPATAPLPTLKYRQEETTTPKPVTTTKPPTPTPVPISTVEYDPDYDAEYYSEFAPETTAEVTPSTTRATTKVTTTTATPRTTQRTTPVTTPVPVPVTTGTIARATARTAARRTTWSDGWNGAWAATRAPAWAATRAPSRAGTREQVTRASVTQVPVTRGSVTQYQVTRAPVTQVPVTRGSAAFYHATRAPVTQLPVTRAPTQAPTEAWTQERTQEWTQTWTQPPTQAPTRAPTQEPTQASTQPPTYAPVPVPSEPPPQPEADPPSWEVTRRVTHPSLQEQTRADTNSPAEVTSVVTPQAPSFSDAAVTQPPPAAGLAPPPHPPASADDVTLLPFPQQHLGGMRRRRIKCVPGKIGVFPDFRSGCRRYHVCSKNKSKTYECPGQLLFNPVKQTCDVPERVTCAPPRRRGCLHCKKPSASSRRHHAHGVPPGFHFECDQLPDGFYPDVARRCHVFYRCHGGQTFSHYCKHGLLFNAKTGNCDFEGSVDCSLPGEERSPNESA